MNWYCCFMPSVPAIGSRSTRIKSSVNSLQPTKYILHFLCTGIWSVPDGILHADHALVQRNPNKQDAELMSWAFSLLVSILHYPQPSDHGVHSTVPTGLRSSKGGVPGSGAQEKPWNLHCRRVGTGNFEVISHHRRPWFFSPGILSPCSPPRSDL